MTRDPWLAYWTSGDAGGNGGCLPHSRSIFSERLDPVWREFGGGLRRGSKVLDLATGNGTVLLKIQAARPGLKLMGIDAAASLPPAPRGMKLRPAVSMEALPFGDHSFDAVTSQFGVEYGRTDEIASQVGRVLKPGGQLLFLLHHRDSDIVRHNLRRRGALFWAVQESGILMKARRLAETNALAQIGVPKAFGQAINDARRLFPGQPVAAEVLTAVWQALTGGRHRPASEVMGVLATLEIKAADEIGRLDALERAACSEERAASIVGHLERAGLSANAATVLFEDKIRPLAWQVRASAVDAPPAVKKAAGRKPAAI